MSRVDQIRLYASTATNLRKSEMVQNSNDSFMLHFVYDVHFLGCVCLPDFKTCLPLDCYTLSNAIITLLCVFEWHPLFIAEDGTVKCNHVHPSHLAQLEFPILLYQEVISCSVYPSSISSHAYLQNRWRIMSSNIPFLYSPSLVALLVYFLVQCSKSTVS